MRRLERREELLPPLPGQPQQDAEGQLSAEARQNKLRFEGFSFEPVAGVYDMHARAYHPSSGRFLSQDRYEDAFADLRLRTDPLTQDRYAFAGGNPVGRVEWDGHYAGNEGGAQRAMRGSRTPRGRRGVTRDERAIPGRSDSTGRAPVTRSGSGDAPLTDAGSTGAGYERPPAVYPSQYPTPPKPRDGGGVCGTFGALCDTTDALKTVGQTALEHAPEAYLYVQETTSPLGPTIRITRAITQGDHQTAALELAGSATGPLGRGTTRTTQATNTLKNAWNRATSILRRDKTEPAIAFAEGLGETALTARRLQHGTKNLTSAGILPSWSGKNSPELIRRALTPILENPSATFNHRLGGKAVRGFLGNLNGDRVALFVYKEGPYQGELASSFAPSANQLRMWGVGPR